VFFLRKEKTKTKKSSPSDPHLVNVLLALRDAAPQPFGLQSDHLRHLGDAPVYLPFNTGKLVRAGIFFRASEDVSIILPEKPPKLA